MYILVGGFLVLVGGLVVFGGISGRLPSMMAAIVGLGKPTQGGTAGGIAKALPTNPSSVPLGPLNKIDHWVSTGLKDIGF